MHNSRLSQIVIHVDFYGGLVIFISIVKSVIEVLTAPLELVVILVFLNHVFPALGVMAFLWLNRVNEQKRNVLTHQAILFQPTSFLIFGNFFP